MRLLRYAVQVILTVLVAGCVCRTGALRSEVSRFRGDGLIEDTSLALVPFFWGPGFRIVFPGFDPTKPYEHSYQFKGVPKSKRQASMIYVRFSDNGSPRTMEDAKSKITAVLTLAVLDGSGTVLKSQEMKFSDAVWSWEGGGGHSGVFGLWISEGANNGISNVFGFDPEESYTLRIVYTPGGVPPDTTNVWVTIENGGKL